jgi:hypothetical protein
MKLNSKIFLFLFFFATGFIFNINTVYADHHCQNDHFQWYDEATCDNNCSAWCGDNGYGGYYCKDAMSCYCVAGWDCADSLACGTDDNACIDATSPTVGAISPSTAKVGAVQTYFAVVSDNVGVTACDLLIDGNNVGIMNISGTMASKSYTFTTGTEGGHYLYARCKDAANNYTNGSPSTLVMVSAPDPCETVCSNAGYSRAFCSDSDTYYKGKSECPSDPANTCYYSFSHQLAGDSDCASDAQKQNTDLKYCWCNQAATAPSCTVGANCRSTGYFAPTATPTPPPTCSSLGGSCYDTACPVSYKTPANYRGCQVPYLNCCVAPTPTSTPKPTKSPTPTPTPKTCLTVCAGAGYNRAFCADSSTSYKNFSECNGGYCNYAYVYKSSGNNYCKSQDASHQYCWCDKQIPAPVCDNNICTKTGYISPTPTPIKTYNDCLSECLSKCTINGNATPETPQCVASCKELCKTTNPPPPTGTCKITGNSCTDIYKTVANKCNADGNSKILYDCYNEICSETSTACGLGNTCQINKTSKAPECNLSQCSKSTDCIYSINNINTCKYGTCTNKKCNYNTTLKNLPKNTACKDQDNKDGKCDTKGNCDTCPLRDRGDANCDSKFDTMDFGIWQNEIMRVSQGTAILYASDFDGNKIIDITDFNIWNNSRLQQ